MLQWRAALVASSALLLLCAAVVVRDSAAPNAEELVAAAATPGGLAQTGAGLQLVQPWDLHAAGGRDARLSDQIHAWGASGTKLKAPGPGFVPATGTQELAQVGGVASLSKKIRTAVDTLRLSDFLTGVKPKVAQKQVQGLYEKMDPRDTTGWMQREHVHRESPAQVQARRVKTYKTMLQHELSTTPDQDSAKAKRVRRQLRELIKRKAAVKRSLNAAMRKEMRNTNSHVWTHRAKDGDDADYLIHQIASPEDRHANYAEWLRSAKGGKRAPQALAGRPHVSAGGQLEWRQRVHKGLQEKQARLQKLSQDDADTAHSRMQALSEDDSKVGASEIAMRQILGKAKKAAHSYVSSEEAHKENKQAEVGRDFAAPHQQLAAKRAHSNLDIVSDAEEGVAPQLDTPESIRERAAYKVSRWMGGGYVDVYGR
jgi:hypothetical protein